MRGLFVTRRGQLTVVLAAWMGFVVLGALALLMFAQSSRYPDYIWYLTLGSRSSSGSLGYWAVSDAFNVIWIGLAIYGVPLVILTAVWVLLRAKVTSGVAPVMLIALGIGAGAISVYTSTFNLFPQLFGSPEARADAKLELDNSSLFTGIAFLLLAVLLTLLGRLLARRVLGPARIRRPADELASDLVRPGENFNPSRSGDSRIERDLGESQNYREFNRSDQD